MGLAVRAAEIRESLKELGFTRDATVRTEELCKFSACTHSDTSNETIAMEEECGRIKDEHKTAHRTINQLQKENETLKEKLAALLEQRDKECPGKLQAERNDAQQ